MPEAVLILDHLAQSFPDGEGGQLAVLQDVSLTLEAGTCAALLGRSGVGKSTLLHMAGLLETPAKGSIRLVGTEASSLSTEAKARFRGRHIGFVYQFHNLLPDFTALENVILPQRLQGISPITARPKAVGLLESLGLGHRLHHFPSKLSGGEQQRVAIARALANDPALLLADEPTGNLDAATADLVFNALLEQIRTRHMAALIATHNPDLAARMDVAYRVENRTLQRVP
jgi:lipoprotein-releasing system ATP-binding protein